MNRLRRRLTGAVTCSRKPVPFFSCIRSSTALRFPTLRYPKAEHTAFGQLGNGYTCDPFPNGNLTFHEEAYGNDATWRLMRLITMDIDCLGEEKQVLLPRRTARPAASLMPVSMA